MTNAGGGDREPSSSEVEILGQLHLNRPSDQLSRRTQRRTLLAKLGRHGESKSATVVVIAKARVVEECPRLVLPFLRH